MEVRTGSDIFPFNVLPGLMRAYERLCRRIASDNVYDLGFFISTYSCGPAGLYLWEDRRGSFLRRLAVGAIAQGVLALGVVFFFAGFGWLLGAVALAIGRPLRWLLRVSHIARPDESPMPPMPPLELGPLDAASLLFIAFVFLAFVANRDDLLQNDMVFDSDPAYHMAVARQVLELGRIPLWDRWEYAPFGRPHLYQPVLHLLIALFSGRPEHVAFGFNTLQMLLYPTALLSGWAFARWLFGAAAAFATVIFLSMETSFLLSQAMVLPAALVTAIMPALLVAFLAKRPTAAAILLGISFYTHMGVPPLMVLGLLLFSMRRREYYPVFRKALAFAGLAYVPWLVGRILPHLDWLGTSSGAMGPAKGAFEMLARGLLQLQIINPILLCLAGWSWWRRSDARLSIVKSMLAGFLPMLFSYGGRYFMHTWPMWAVLVALNFEGWLQKAQGKGLRRRAGVLLALALVPLPVITFGMPGALGLKVFPGPTGANAAIWLAVWRSEPDRDFERMAEFIRSVLPPSRISDAPPPRQADKANRRPDRELYARYLASEEYSELSRRIVHIGREPYGSLYLADRISAATGHRTDSGGWGPEVRKEIMLEELERARREDPECLFVFRKKHGTFSAEEVERLLREHRLEWGRQFGGRYLVGARGLARVDETF